MSTKRVNYSTLPGLENVYFEDSYVLGISANLEAVEFTLDLVLTEEHPLYRHPKLGEQYCFCQATLTFTEPKQFLFEKAGTIPAKDASGAIDYGNIDIFEVDDAGWFHLAGEWGKLQLKGQLPSVVFVR